MSSLYFPYSSDSLDRDDDKALEDGESTMWKDPGSLNYFVKNYSFTRINQPKLLYKPEINGNYI